MAAPQAWLRVLTFWSSSWWRGSDKRADLERDHNSACRRGHGGLDTVGLADDEEPGDRDVRVPPDVRVAAEQRALVMSHSDRWVRDRCDAASPLIDEGALTLVRGTARRSPSHTKLANSFCGR